MHSDGAPALAIVEVAKSYEDKAVLADITLRVPAGERCCLVGGNGSGKTTLLEMVMGLKQPTRGRIEVLGHDPADPRLRGRRVMLMDRSSFPYYAKVKEVVWLYSGFCPGTTDVPVLLRSFDLDGNGYVRHLSKGQRQRLGVLIAFLGNPDLILLDEPASGLDPQARMTLWQMLSRKLDAASPRTLLFTTHDLAEAERWADRVAVLHHGRLIAVGSPAELCQTVIGSRRKLVLAGRQEIDASPWPLATLAPMTHLGTEAVFYTDQPEGILEQIGTTKDRYQIRIEDVSLRDAFLQLTGEVPDGTPARHPM